MTDANTMDNIEWIPWAHVPRLVKLGYVSERTARHWRRTRKLPAWALGWLKLMDGDLGRLEPAFAGWRIKNGALKSPDGWAFHPGEIETVPFRHQQIRALESEIRALKCRDDEMTALILAWAEYLGRRGLMQQYRELEQLMNSTIKALPAAPARVPLS
jgi:hypothetical protein